MGQAPQLTQTIAGLPNGQSGASSEPRWTICNLPSKRLTRMLGPKLDPDTIEATVEALADAWDDAEAHEGVAAFFDKRKPAWKV